MGASPMKCLELDAEAFQAFQNLTGDWTLCKSSQCELLVRLIVEGRDGDRQKICHQATTSQAKQDVGWQHHHADH